MNVDIITHYIVSGNFIVLYITKLFGVDVKMKKIIKYIGRKIYRFFNPTLEDCIKVAALSTSYKISDEDLAELHAELDKRERELKMEKSE